MAKSTKTRGILKKKGRAFKMGMVGVRAGLSGWRGLSKAFTASGRTSLRCRLAAPVGGFGFGVAAGLAQDGGHEHG